MGDKRFGNYNSCCRLCLSEQHSSLKSIFDDSSESREMVQKIHTCVGIEIHEEDKISIMICDRCFGKISGWHDYKNECSENQDTLLSWLSIWNSNQLADVSFVVKDEPDEDSNKIQEIVIDDDDSDVQVKSEPMETDPMEPECEILDDFDDSPPLLTPYTVNENFDRNSIDSQNLLIPTKERMLEIIEIENGDSSDRGDDEVSSQISSDSRTCSICDKVFSTPGNRKKHEKTIHGRKSKNFKTVQDVEYISLDVDSMLGDERTQTSISSSSTTDTSKTATNGEKDTQKIQFAAGLQLQQRSENSAPVPTNRNTLTKVETSYADKCKAMAKMFETFVCACHNEQHNSTKQILTHLRAQRTWFPVYTCYNCMITFTDRSTHMKHFGICPRQRLQHLIRLSEIRKSYGVKLRLYLNYKCIHCNFFFSFHEDFCEHVDNEHLLETGPPFVCECGKVFTSVNDYKIHVYLTCLVQFYCDICYKTFSNLESFEAHCEDSHDQEEGFTLVAQDNFRKRSLPPYKSDRMQDLRSFNDESRRKSAPDLQPDGLGEHMPEPRKVINPHAIHRNVKMRPTSCEVCGKTYSNYFNMLRHAKIHEDSSKVIECLYCQERFRLAAELKEHVMAVHESPEENQEMEVAESNDSNSKLTVNQFKYSCPDCRELFQTLEEWTAHKETHPKLSCDECGKQFAFQTELDQHRSVHLNIKVYRDSKTQDYKSAMISPILMCEICDKRFNTKSELRQHKLLHEKMPVLSIQQEIEGEEEKKDLSDKYTCTICNKHYVGYGGLWDHNKKHHPGRQIPREYPRQCKYCDKILYSGGSWFMHKQMHVRLARQVAQMSQPDLETASQPSPRSKSPKDDDDLDNESYHTCKKCFKVFSNKYNLKNHMKSHGINPAPNRSAGKTGKYVKMYWCDICHQACPGLSELQKHKEEHDNENMPEVQNPEETPEPKKPHVFTCNICTKTFTTNFALNKHKERHEEEEEKAEPVQRKPSVNCRYCKLSFEDNQRLGEHMEREHDEPKSKIKAREMGKKFPCSLCKKVFDTASALCSHQGWHKRGKVEKQMRTQEKLFRKMVKQIPKTQTATPKYQCYTCSLCFSNDTALQIHILETHRNINATMILPRCNACDVDFDSQAAYDKHQQLHKLVEQQKNSPGLTSKAHPCKFCNSAFSRSDSLYAHVKQYHKEHIRDTFECSQCERVFEKQNALTIHLKVHERQRLQGETSARPVGKNLYSCSICKFGFATAKELRTHVINQHPF